MTKATAHTQQTGRSSYGELWVRCKCGDMPTVMVNNHDTARQRFAQHVCATDHEVDEFGYCEEQCDG